MTRDAISQYRIAGDRVFLAGFSAGGAMVPIMLSTHPELFSGAAIHSGLAYGAAEGVADAFRAMSRGSPDPGQKAREMFEQMKSSSDGMTDPVPVRVVHGAEDQTVYVGNVLQIASQMAYVNLQILRDRGGDPRLRQTESRHLHRRRAFREMTITDRESTTRVKMILRGFRSRLVGRAGARTVQRPQGTRRGPMDLEFFRDGVLSSGGRTDRGPTFPDSKFGEHRGRWQRVSRRSIREPSGNGFRR